MPRHGTMACHGLPWPRQVAMERAEEQRLDLEREIKEAKDALNQLRSEAAAVEHSILSCGMVSVGQRGIFGGRVWKNVW